MAQAAHATQWTAGHSQDTRLYNGKVGDDLSARIRALSIARSESFPSRAPCSTHDLTYLPHQLGPSGPPERPLANQFDVPKATQKPSRLESRMVTRMYDGGNSHNEESSVSIPGVLDGQHIGHGHVEHSYHGDAVRSLAALNRRRNAPRPKVEKVQSTVIESSTSDGPERMPGSFNVEDAPQPPIADGRSSPTESYTSASSALSRQSTIKAQRRLRQKSSQSTITSRTSQRSTHHHLLATNKALVRSGDTIEPVVSTGIEEVASFVSSPNAVIVDVKSTVDEDSHVKTKAETISTSRQPTSTNRESPILDHEKIVNPTVNPSGTEISRLLARLPPLKEVVYETSHSNKPKKRTSSKHSDHLAVEKDKPENSPYLIEPVQSTPTSRSRALSIASAISNGSSSRKGPSSISPKSHQLTLREELQGKHHSPSMLSVANSDSTGQTVNVRSRPRLNKTPSMESRGQWIRSFFEQHPTMKHSTLTARPSHQWHSTASQPRRVTMPTMAEIAALVEEEAKAREQVKSEAAARPASPEYQGNAESFAQVIYDLEGLLHEALKMAQEASDKKDTLEARALKPKQIAERPEKDEAVAVRLGSVPPPKAPTYLNSSSKRVSGVMEATDATTVNGRNIGRKASTASPSSLPPSHNAPPIIHTARKDPIEKAVDSTDWTSASWKELGAYKPRQPSRPAPPPLPPRAPEVLQVPSQEKKIFVSRANNQESDPASREDAHQHIRAHNAPLIQPRLSSLRLHTMKPTSEAARPIGFEKRHSSESDSDSDSGREDFAPIRPGYRQSTAVPVRQSSSQVHDFGQGKVNDLNSGKHSHFIVRDHLNFSLSRTHRRAPIARDWSDGKKRWVATITCLNTMLLGFIIGIYAGEVPAIQYTIVDEHHYAILGNVVLFFGLALSTTLFWPLPILHGRKPYTLGSLTMLLVLQFPQALILSRQRSPNNAGYRTGLLLSRAFSGFFLGFASINFQTTLLDIFGASLQSSNPHQETVDSNDVRRHGGGMGLWLGFWTWSFIGSIGVGFLIGAAIISGLTVQWGFWITIIMTAAVLLLNVLVPEVRRSAYRRSVTEVRDGREVSHRVARGEIKMHLDATGPVVWYEEVFAGYRLMAMMLRQPGFTALAIYTGWIYGQVIMIVVLLGALLSRYYRFRPQFVGLCVFAISIGALLAIPFEKASIFSRARTHRPRTDSMTFEKRVTWTSHLVRRSAFMILLPFAGLAYTLSSGGPDTSWALPTVFAGSIGFFSNLAIAECNGLIMETYDTSDLQPGMTGRPRHALPDELRKKQTNYSCYPRISAGFAITQTFSFLIAAGATWAGGAIERRLGAQAATGVVAGILLVLTLFLIAALTRIKAVQIVPTQRYGTNILSGPEDEWKPIIIGHPSGTTRRISLLETGTMSRWTEIRKRNRLATGFPEEMELGALTSKT